MADGCDGLVTAWPVASPPRLIAAALGTLSVRGKPALERHSMSLRGAVMSPGAEDEGVMGLGYSRVSPETILAWTALVSFKYPLAPPR
jgi:hypothetical protein